MLGRRNHALLLILVLFALLTISALPALAGSASVAGTFPVGGSPKMPVIFISPPNCTGQGAVPVQYHAYSFSVDTSGTYTLNMAIASGNLSLYLHSAGFNPAAGFPTCLSGDNSDPIGVSFALAAGATYYAVPFDDSFSQAGGSYTLTISGPGNVTIVGINSGGAINDGRINAFDLAAPYAVYCTSNGVEVWAIDSAGHGSLAFTASSDAVSAVDASAANALVMEGAGIRLFKLSSGELQVVGAPDFEGKVYDVLFRAFPCSLIDTTLH